MSTIAIAYPFHPRYLIPNTRYRVVFFGTSDFALSSLESLLKDARFEVVGIVTQKEKPSGRSQELQLSPAATFAVQHKIELQTPETLKDPEFQTWVKNLAPDIALVASYGKIIPKSILEIPTYGCINIHPSLLPKYRGPTPVPYTLLNGETKTAVTIMLMNEQMDEGDILTQIEADIAPEDNSQTLLPKLFQLAADTLPGTLVQFIQKRLKPIPQDHTQASYSTRLTKEMGKIDWQKETAEQIVNKIRAFTPWPGVYALLDGKRLKILSAIFRRDAINRVSTPGEIIKDQKVVETKYGLLEPQIVQLEGKKPVSFDDFLRGYKTQDKLILT